MSSLQDVFARIQDAKKRQRELRKMVNDALKQSSHYADIMDEIGVLKEKKKVIEDKVKEEFFKELDMLADIKQEMKEHCEKLADLVLASITSGEIIKVHDAYNNAYDPIVKVSFKKSDDSQA